MKLAVVILVVLGLLAAGSAVVLVQAMKFNTGGQDLPTVDVLVAQGDLPARTRVTGEQVRVRPMPKAGLPQGYLVDPSQAIGKVLKLAVAKGQPVAESCFMTKTSVDDLLRPGMLAFQIPLSRSNTAVDLLYPGCAVDVFATFPLSDRSKGEALAVPLLQDIRVLGVRDETVVSTPEPDKLASRTASSSGAYSGSVTVTLEVNSRQVAALQLALQHGSLGIAMRGLLDKSWKSMEPMVLKEGRLTAASEALDPSTLRLFGTIQKMLAGEPVADVNTVATAAQRPAGAAAEPNAVKAGSPSPEGVPEYAPVIQQEKKPWTITIIRGSKIEDKEVQEEEKSKDEKSQGTQG
jgi:pilus assembly protein CpaB